MEQQYIDLITASLEAIDWSYFHLTTTYRKMGITRERVFCYEFYHQMRLNMSARSQHNILSLHGEIDKRGHPDFVQGHCVNPDFVFHQPGTHENNGIVIEVKGNLTPKGIGKDLTTLKVFTSEYHYKLGIFIIFNHSLEDFVKTIKPKISKLNLTWIGQKLPILVIAIKQPHEKCREKYLSELF